MVDFFVGVMTRAALDGDRRSGLDVLPDLCPNLEWELENGNV